MAGEFNIVFSRKQSQWQNASLRKFVSHRIVLFICISKSLKTCYHSLGNLLETYLNSKFLSRVVRGNILDLLLVIRDEPIKIKN